MTKTLNLSVEWLMKNLSTSIDIGHKCTQCGNDWCQCNAPTEIDFDLMLCDKLGIEEGGSDLTYISYLNLADDVLAHGFRQPICIVSMEDGWMQGNGHHRLCIAILLCMDTIPVVISTDPREYMMDWITEDDGYGHWHNN